MGSSGGPPACTRLVVDPSVVMRRGDIDLDFAVEADLYDHVDPVPVKFKGMEEVYAPAPNPFIHWEHRSKSGLVAAFTLAYSHHLPLRLSPDVLWITILQSVSQWVNSDDRAEKYRSVFVAHADKITLQVCVPSAWQSDRSLVDWPAVLSQIRTMAAGHVHNGIVEACAPRFTTTTVSSAVACTIAVLDIVKNYFNYGIMMLCGLGEVELAGTPADWAALHSRTADLQGALGPVGEALSAWFAQLDGTLTELAATAAGRAPDVAFWQHAYSRDIIRGSGRDTHYILSGWFLHFYEAGEKPVTKISLGDLPSGFVTVPFFWDKLDGSREMFSLCAGTWNAYIDEDGVVFCEPQWVVLPGDVAAPKLKPPAVAMAPKPEFKPRAPLGLGPAGAGAGTHAADAWLFAAPRRGGAAAGATETAMLNSTQLPFW
jgi:hypothetical protein